MDGDDPICDFSLGSTTSSLSGLLPSCPTKKTKKDKKEEEEQSEEKGGPCAQFSNSFPSSMTSSSSTTINLAAIDSQSMLKKPTRMEPPNIGYELNIAKSILQQHSTLSGDSLFDHISDVIKRVIDERPPNVIDFFEEFSRNVREQKFHLPERFPPNAVFETNRFYAIAKQIMLSLKLPYAIEGEDLAVAAEHITDEDTNILNEELYLPIDDSMRKFVTFNERVQQLQFYWNQCGLSISSDDIFQLASAMNRLQTHPSIMQCRFWGCINGLKASYYIVEASLTRDEINSRLTMMEEELREKQLPFQMRSNAEERATPSHIGPELTPGIYGWENYAADELAKMPKAADIPLTKEIEFYDIPPEYIGLGCNRYSYFVVNSLYEDWIELPIVTPRQIIVSRHIKKMFTGDLEANVVSYPCFPGKEKHYLRATIARITAGTLIAPQGYYRRMTRKEKRLYEGEDDDEEEEEEEEEEHLGEEDEIVDNDVMLLKNERYVIESVGVMATPVAWVHIRPNILNQGRIEWFDEEQARKEREKALARYLKMRLLEEMEEEGEEEEVESEDEEEGEEEGMNEDFNAPEIGPNILSSCANDTTDQLTVPWQAHLSSKYTNQKERVLIMQSNVWPGAYTFLFEDVCDSIYLGWGHKYFARNMPFKHLPEVQEEYPHGPESFIEASDPTVEEEKAYREWLLGKFKKPNESDEEKHLYEDEELEGQDDNDNDDDDDNDND